MSALSLIEADQRIEHDNFALESRLVGDDTLRLGRDVSLTLGTDSLVILGLQRCPIELSDNITQMNDISGQSNLIVVA
jgi:hypothetical protein